MFDLSKPWPATFSRRAWLLAAAIFAVALFALYWLDASISSGARTLPGPVVDFFRSITDFGDSAWILIPALGLFLLSGALGLLIPKPVAKRALLQMTGIWAFIFVGVALPGLIAALIKRGLGRGRPELFDQVGSFDLQSFVNGVDYQSFPSGHTTTAFALCFVIAFMAPRWFPWAVIFAVLIGLSRIVVGVHYPTDVLGGAVLGTFGAYAVRNFFASRRWVFKRQPDDRIVMRDLSAVRRLARGRR